MEPNGRCGRSRFYRAAVLAAILSFGLVGTAAGSGKPGWSLAKASAHLELRLRLVFPDTVTQARQFLTLAKQQGDVGNLAQGQEDLRLAKAGMQVDRASCAGIKAAPGGYVVFRCRLLLSDDLFFTGKATGTWKRLPSGNWRWFTSSFVRTGIGPAEWLPDVRG